MAQWINQVLAVFKSKTVWARVLITLAVLGLMAFMILTDQSWHFGEFGCDSKSKVNVDIKKGN